MPAAPSDKRSSPYGLSTGDLILHIVLSRLIYLGGGFLGSVLATGPYYNNDIPVPSLGRLWTWMQGTAIAYGDIGWYGGVAKDGYAPGPFIPGLQLNWAFFPLFPGLMKIVTAPAAMFLVPQLVFAASLLLLHRYLKSQVDRPVGDLAVLLVAYFPFSYVLSQFRPEGLLLLLTVAALELARGGRTWAAAGAGLLAGFAKPNAFLTSLLLLRHADPRVRRNLLVLGAPGVGIVVMCVWLWLRVGDPLAWAKVQGAWGAEFAVVPLRELGNLFRKPLLVGRGGWDPILLNWIIFGAHLAAVVALCRKRCWDWALFALLYAGLTFANQGVFTMGKHLATCIPLFVGMACWAKRPQQGVALLLACAAALVTMSLFNGAGMAFTEA